MSYGSLSLRLRIILIFLLKEIIFCGIIGMKVMA